MATTTLSLVRAQIVTVVKALTPTAPIDTKFDRCPMDMPLREWANRNATDACFRMFQMTRIGEYVDPNVYDPSQILRDTRCELVIAYPMNVALYGSSDIDSMEDVMDSDAHKIRDALVSPGNLISGWQGTTEATILAPEREGNPWFQAIHFTVVFDRAQTIT